MTLDDRLTKIFAYGIDWTEYKDKSEYDHDTSMFAAKIKAQHKKALEQAILSDLLEIIGEDENSMVEEQYASPQPTVDEHYRNRLRQELRDKVKEYCE